MLWGIGISVAGLLLKSPAVLAAHAAVTLSSQDDRVPAQLNLILAVYVADSNGPERPCERFNTESARIRVPAVPT
jgi:hypothetical protein